MRRLNGLDMKWIFGNGDENICRNNISTSNFKVRFFGEVCVLGSYTWSSVISVRYEAKVKIPRVASKQETIFLVRLVCSFKKK